MLEALILTLREGVEAALVVGIIVAFLRKEDGDRYLKAVWSGLTAAVAASIAGAFVLYRIAVNQEGFEGILYLASAVMVASLVIWMWRHSHALSGKMRGSLARILDRGNTGWAFAGLFLFTFLMVFREGVETALFLSALSLTSSGLMAFLGAVVGIAVAVVFGVLFVRGSLRIQLDRFFKATGIALMIFVVQLLFNAYHELSEAGWVPANPKTMGLIGPLVRNEIFFIAAVVLCPILLLLLPGRASKEVGETTGGTDAAARLERARARRFQRVRTAFGTLGIVVLAVLSLGVAYSQPPQLSPATPIDLSSGEVRLPVAGFADGELHRFVARVGDHDVRFFGIEVQDGEVVTAFDACLICGDRGYIQEGSVLTCLHCHSAIYPPSVGLAGGCNPIPLKSRVEGDEIVIALGDLKSEATRFTRGAGETDHTAHRSHAERDEHDEPGGHGGREGHRAHG